MSLSDPYASPQEYREVTRGTDAGADAVINRDLTAVSRWLESKLGRFFNKDASDATRLYIPEARKDTLWVDDLTASPTSIKIDEDGDGDFADETALASTDFQLRPLNALVQPEAQPFTHIAMTPWGTKGTWPHGLQVQIIGKFGWPAVPDLVKIATIEFTRLLRLETPRATTRITELEGMIGMSRPAQAMLNELVSHYSRKVPFG